MSSCTFPNHLCHLQEMPRANIPGSYYSKNITHVVLRHIRVLTYLAGFQKGEPFQSQTTEIYPGLWPFSPQLTLGLTETGERTGMLIRRPGSCSSTSLPTLCIVSDWSISTNTNRGNKTKTWHRRCVTAYSLCCWGHCSLISWALWLSLLGQRGRMQAMLWERGDKRKGAQKNPRANQQ